LAGGDPEQATLAVSLALAAGAVAATEPPGEQNDA